MPELRAAEPGWGAVSPGVPKRPAGGGGGRWSPAAGGYGELAAYDGSFRRPPVVGNGFLYGLSKLKNARPAA